MARGRHKESSAIGIWTSMAQQRSRRRPNANQRNSGESCKSNHEGWEEEACYQRMEDPNRGCGSRCGSRSRSSSCKDCDLITSFCTSLAGKSYCSRIYSRFDQHFLLEVCFVLRSKLVVVFHHLVIVLYGLLDVDVTFKLISKRGPINIRGGTSSNAKAVPRVLLHPQRRITIHLHGCVLTPPTL